MKQQAAGAMAQLKSGLNSLARFADTKRATDTWWLLAGLAVLGYCAARLALLSMTHDESSTVMIFQGQSWRQVLMNEPPTANNHVLNTLLVKLFSLGGLHKALVRLPNLLAGLLYLYFAYRLVGRMSRTWAGHLLGFSLLVLNAYMLEFFSLARGYGLSLGFLMGSLYFLYRFVEDRGLRSLGWSLALAVLACYSNLTLLNYFVALVVAANLFLLAQPGSPGWRLWLHANDRVLLAALILGALLYFPVSTNLASGQLYFGGKNGFFADTARSLAHQFAYAKSYRGVDMAPVFFYGSLALLGLSLAKSAYQAVRQRVLPADAVFIILLLLMAASNIVQHHWLGTRYLVDRTALLYFPIVALAVFTLFDGWPSWSKLALALILAAHFLACVQMSQTREWWYDRFTEKAMRYVHERREEGQHVRLGAHWLFFPTIHYYRMAWDIDYLIGPSWEDGPAPDKLYEYYYLPAEDAHKLPPGYEVERDFEGYWLVRWPQGQSQ
jgi:putative effector of murein hydrolase LrgA (UPF0299 family)